MRRAGGEACQAQGITVDELQLICVWFAVGNRTGCSCLCFYFWLFHVKGHVKLALIIKKITIYWEAFFENVYLNVNIFLFKIVFSSQPSDEESSSDDTSHEPSPALRRRRNRKKTVSISESEEPPLAEPGDEASKEPNKRHSSGGLNKCVILALVIAVSMGFGHFYGKCLDTPCADGHLHNSSKTRWHTERSVLVIMAYM